MSSSGTRDVVPRSDHPGRLQVNFLPCPKSSATVAKRLGMPEKGSQSPCRLCWFLLYPQVDSALTIMGCEKLLFFVHWRPWSYTVGSS